MIATVERDDLRVAEGVLSEVVDGEAVLLHLGTGKYFGLNRTGTRIWQLLGESASAARIVATVASETGADEETVQRDFAELVKDLTERGLLTRCRPR